MIAQKRYLVELKQRVVEAVPRQVFCLAGCEGVIGVWG